ALSRRAGVTVTVAVAAATTVAALAAAAPEARADEIKLPETRAVIDVPRGWTPVELAAGRGLVAGYRGERGVVRAIPRVQVLNLDTYRLREREAYAEQLGRGVAASVPGYRRVSRRLGERHGTPALDLEARADGGKTIVVRVLLFWTYALALAIEVPP